MPTTPNDRSHAARVVDLLPGASDEELHAFVTAQLDDRALQPTPRPTPTW